MSDPTILFIKPKAISSSDKKALRAAGVVVVEVDDPQAVRLMKAAVEIDGSELLQAAVKAIHAHNSTTDSVKSLFGRAVCEAITKRVQP